MHKRIFIFLLLFFLLFTFPNSVLAQEHKLAVGVGDWVEYTIKEQVGWTIWNAAIGENVELKVGDVLKYKIVDMGTRRIYDPKGRIAWEEEIAICNVYLNNEKIMDHRMALIAGWLVFNPVGEGVWGDVENLNRAWKEWFKGTNVEYDYSISNASFGYNYLGFPRDVVIERLSLSYLGEETVSRSICDKALGLLLEFETRVKTASTVKELHIVINNTNVSLSIPVWFILPIAIGVAVTPVVFLWWWKRKHTSKIQA